MKNVSMKPPHYPSTPLISRWQLQCFECFGSLLYHISIRSFEILQQTERKYNVKYMEYGDQNLHSSWRCSWCESPFMSRKPDGKTKTLTICNRVDRHNNIYLAFVLMVQYFSLDSFKKSLSDFMMQNHVPTWIDCTFGTAGFEPMVQ